MIELIEQYHAAETNLADKRKDLMIGIFQQFTQQIKPSPDPPVTFDYYVSSLGGSDGNDGLTEATPWQTMDKALTAPLATGQSIGFERGGTYTPGSTMSQPWVDGVKVKAYGASGPLPVFDFTGLAIGISPGNDQEFHEIDFANATNDCVTVGNRNTLLFKDCICRGSGDQNYNLLGSNCTTTIEGGEISGALVDDGISGHEGNLICRGVTFSNNFQHINCLSVFGSLLVEDCQFLTTNDVEGTNLAIIVIDGAVTPTWRRCRFKGRSSFGDYHISSAGVFEYCNFDSSPLATAAQGLAPNSYRITSTGDQTFSNCDFHGGDYGTGRHHGDFNTNGHTVTFNNCIFQRWQRMNGAATLNNCSREINIASSLTENNAIAGDTLLTDPSSDDWSLGAGSPAIAAGVNLGLTANYVGDAVTNPPNVGAV